jgi:hypothetical protein
MSGNGLCLAAYGRDVHGEDCISDFMEHKLFHLLPGEGYCGKLIAQMARPWLKGFSLLTAHIMEMEYEDALP